jgi:phage tail sheath protein FI
MLTEPYPRVHVREIPSGVRTIMGVSTSTACFVGRTRKGQLNKPSLVTSFEDFDRKFSSETVASDLARSVKLFFANGANRAYIVRIADSATVQAATSTLEGGGTASEPTICTPKRRSSGTLRPMQQA